MFPANRTILRGVLLRINLLGFWVTAFGNFLENVRSNHLPRLLPADFILTTPPGLNPSETRKRRWFVDFLSRGRNRKWVFSCGKARRSLADAWRVYLQSCDRESRKMDGWLKIKVVRAERVLCDADRWRKTVRTRWSSNLEKRLPVPPSLTSLPSFQLL